MQQNHVFKRSEVDIFTHIWLETVRRRIIRKNGEQSTDQRSKSISLQAPGEILPVKQRRDVLTSLTVPSGVRYISTFLTFFINVKSEVLSSVPQGFFSICAVRETKIYTFTNGRLKTVW